MEVRPCKQCRRLFNYLNGEPICPSCKDMLEKKFVEVKEYVREHKTEGINEVAKANDVTVNQIRRWIREDRLAFSEESGMGVDCESCGKMIKSGRLCQSCKDKLLGKVEDMYKTDDSIVAKKHREAAKMRFMEH
ncbi:MAG: flagellar protein [Eubacteriales bacterium]|nr:flagellar protein [Eubacteriales bacterium]